MKGNKTLLLLVVFVVLSVITYFIVHEPGEKTTTYKLEKQLFAVDSALTDKVDIEQKGKKISFAEAQNQLAERDKRDTERAIAPLKIPDNAIVVDNSLYTIDETVDLLVNYVKKN